MRASRPFAPCTVITRTSSRAISRSRFTSAEVARSHAALGQILSVKQYENLTYCHSVNVAMLSLLLGRQVGLDDGTHVGEHAGRESLVRLEVDRDGDLARGAQFREPGDRLDDEGRIVGALIAPTIAALQEDRYVADDAVLDGGPRLGEDQHFRGTGEVLDREPGELVARLLGYLAPHRGDHAGEHFVATHRIGRGRNGHRAHQRVVDKVVHEPLERLGAVEAGAEQRE